MAEEVLAYFEKDGDYLKPFPWARNPWTPTGTHGRLCAGLIAREVERLFGSPDYHFTRLTTDLFRMAPLDRLQVRAQLIRDGNRIKVADGEVIDVNGVVVARASAVLLKKFTPNPEGGIWKNPNWKVPHPDTLELPARNTSTWHDPIRQTKEIPAQPDGRKRCWIRDHGQLVLGEDMSPFVRVASQADYTNPFMHSSYNPVGFINADITMYLHRDTVGEWVGFEASAHQATDGVAVGSTIMYDEHGPIGNSLVCSVADDRRRNRTGER